MKHFKKGSQIAVIDNRKIHTIEDKLRFRDSLFIIGETVKTSKGLFSKNTGIECLPNKHQDKIEAAAIANGWQPVTLEVILNPRNEDGETALPDDLIHDYNVWVRLDTLPYAPNTFTSVDEYDKTVSDKFEAEQYVTNLKKRLCL